MTPRRKPSPFRAKRYLHENGVSLNDLVERFGMSGTTWSLFLAAQRPIEGGRERVGEILVERGLDEPAWLWDDETPETAGTSYRTAVPAPAKQPEVLMDAQILSDGARQRFSLFRDPFGENAIAGADGGPRVGQMFLSRAHRAVHMRVQQAAFASGFAAVYGAPGTGKSLVKERALQDAARLADPHDLVRITPANIDRQRMTVNHIVSELLRQLSDEKLPQAANERDAMLARVLLQRHTSGSGDNRVTLVIDEAHELPWETLKNLKRLHEGHHGFRPLLGIVIIGQLELRAKLDASRNPMLTEVALRAHKIELSNMDPDEVRGYMASRLDLVGDRHVDDLFELDAVQELERQPDQMRTPLNLNNIAAAALNCTHARGWDRVTAECVHDVLAAARDPQSRELQRWGSL